MHAPRFSLRSLRFCARRGYFPAVLLCRAVQPAAHEQRADVGIAAGEIAEEIQCLAAAAAREEGAPKTVAVLAREPAMRFDPLDGGRIKHLTPKIRIVTGRVTASENVREVTAAIAGRHRAKI